MEEEKFLVGPYGVLAIAVVSSLLSYLAGGGVSTDFIPAMAEPTVLLLGPAPFWRGSGGGRGTRARAG